MAVSTRTKKTASIHADTDVPWWKGGVIYQVYVRSFYDSNGDGVGDLPGVTAKLDYLQQLGVDCIWLSPVTKSSNFDWGYDVCDYYDVDPALGTLDDFDNLVKAAKDRGIRMLLDLVPNHTSIHHPWFKNALTGHHAEYRDFYIWASPKKDGRPPNNWRAYGGGPAWTYHPPTGQYYLHNFFKQQPDLNWRNPKVQEEFDRIIRFWMDRGIAGFRIDVFNMIIKDAQLRDNPKATPEDGLENRIFGQRPVHNVSQPEVHDVLKRWRKITDSYSPRGLLLGESTLIYDVRQLAAFYGASDELELVFNLSFYQSPFKANALKQVVAQTDEAIASPNWPVWTGSNHDNPRFPSKWAMGDERKIRIALLVIMTLRGTPVIYYGDEFGQQDVFVAPWRLKDPRGRRNWPVDGGRDRARGPMQWQNRLGAGFTREDVRPWLPYGDLKQRSVEVQENTQDSTLHFSRALIALRHAEPDLQLGDYKLLRTVSSVWAWKRGERHVIAINFSAHHHEIKHQHGEIVLSTKRQDEGQAIDGLLHLDPWEGVVLQKPS